MLIQNEISPALQARIDRLQNNVDCLFSLGNIREQCQQVLITFYSAQQPSPYANWGEQLSNDAVLRFAQTLTLTYLSTKNEIVQWANGCTDEYLLDEVVEWRKNLIEDFAQKKIASRWYQMKDDNLWWRKFAYNIPFNDANREREIKTFFEILDKICILTDILLGHAEEYGIDVDYSNCISSQEDDTTVRNIPTSNRQAILDQLLDYADKGDWVSGITSENVKRMLKTVLGLGESPLTGKEAEMSDTLWNLLESGRSERLRVTWQNLVGYYDDRHLLKQKSAPALNTDFFGDKEGSDNINKGRPSRDNMSSGFREVLPLLDAYVPKLDKSGRT